MDLHGRVALVAGATRGAGRGIAAALGEAGATVICTGRTTREQRSEADRPETIEETAELVDSLGGEGIAIPTDHLDPEQVARLADIVRSDHGHLDVLVNDLWGAEHLHHNRWDQPIWEHDLAAGLRLLRLGVESHLVTAHHLLPLLITQPGGLHVELTDGTAAHNATRYRLNTYYDLAKASVNRLAFSLGHELAPHGATAVAVTPGWLRSEGMLEAFGVTEATWRDAIPTHPGFEDSETPRYVGRGIAAMAADDDKARWHQRSVTSGDLAKAYGIADVDGSQPDIWPIIEAAQAG